MAWIEASLAVNLYSLVTVHNHIVVDIGDLTLATQQQLSASEVEDKLLRHRAGICECMYCV